MSYYFISIGGSGARVLESLTHLCAAGLLPNQERNGTLYAMSIDPDEGNGNLNRTERLINFLRTVQEVNVGTGTPLLKTPLKKTTPFIWNPTPRGSRLDHIIAFPSFQGTPVGKLYESLYTKEERDTALDEGFRGHPSIGAMVMANKAHAHKDWQNFVAAVNSDVLTNHSAQIFLAGSIFGGTGAAGLPTIARLLREELNVHVNNGKVRIGGALLLPYFSFTPTEEQRQNNGLFASSDNFLTNTKAALRYYSDTGGGGFDSIYFIGDETMAPVTKFSVGASNQCNDAHIVDFFAAMAALNFYQKNAQPGCYCISRNDENIFKWSDVPSVKMDDGTSVSVQTRFAQFARFIFAYLYIVKPVLSDLEAGRIKKNAHPWYVDYFQNVRTGNADVMAFEQFAESFARWLNQVEHSTGARAVELIDTSSFRVDGNKITIEPKFFTNLDYSNRNLDIQKVASRLNKKGSIFDIILNRGKAKQDLGEGFGRFLRRLYDSCAVN